MIEIDRFLYTKVSDNANTNFTLRRAQHTKLKLKLNTQKKNILLE